MKKLPFDLKPVSKLYSTNKHIKHSAFPPTENNNHLDIKQDVTIGAVKIWSSDSSKTWNFSGSSAANMSKILPKSIEPIVEVDKRQQYNLVVMNTYHPILLFVSKEVPHKANLRNIGKKMLQHKAIHTDKLQLTTIYENERRLTAESNCQVLKQILTYKKVIRLKNLTHLLFHNLPYYKGKKAVSQWGQVTGNRKRLRYCPLHYVLYSGKGTDVSRNLFQLYADLVGGRNVAMRMLLLRQDGCNAGLALSAPKNFERMGCSEIYHTLYTLHRHLQNVGKLLQCGGLPTSGLKIYLIRAEN